MNRRTTSLLAGTAATALTASVLLVSSGTSYGSTSESGAAPQAIGLTSSQRLVAFGLDDPGTVRNRGQVVGLTGDTRLVGIDFRVQDGRLYGVGDAGGVYQVNTQGARATKVDQLSAPLEGTSFDIDFNPAANALRIVSDTGQNLRYSFASRVTFVDGGLTYPPATTPATGITGAAYTNNDLDASTATTLFDLDAAMDQVAIQSPANSGQLSGTGKLGVDAVGDAGFDIRSELSGGKTQDVSAWATMGVGGGYRLYSVSLLTGAADDLGSFPQRWQVVDLAVELDADPAT